MYHWKKYKHCIIWIINEVSFKSWFMVFKCQKEHFLKIWEVGVLALYSLNQLFSFSTETYLEKKFQAFFSALQKIL